MATSTAPAGTTTNQVGRPADLNAACVALRYAVPATRKPGVAFRPPAGL
jgi:hypothetical protein